MNTPRLHTACCRPPLASVCKNRCGAQGATPAAWQSQLCGVLAWVAFDSRLTQPKGLLCLPIFPKLPPSHLPALHPPTHWPSNGMTATSWCWASAWKTTCGLPPATGTASAGTALTRSATMALSSVLGSTWPTRWLPPAPRPMQPLNSSPSSARPTTASTTAT